MQSLPDRLTLPALRLATCLLLLVTWLLPAWGKLSAGGVPSGFEERFASTFLAQFPGVAASFYSIAVLEAAAALLALASLVRGEFLARSAPLLTGSLLLSVFIFVQLGFGLRLTRDNDGAHNLFMYAVGVMAALMVLRFFERDQRLDADGV